MKGTLSYGIEPYSTVKDLIKKIKDFKKLKNINKYKVYIKYCDSLYTVTNIESLDDEVWIDSTDNRKKKEKEMKVKKFLKLLKNSNKKKTFCFSPATRIDKNLEMQMDDVTICKKVAIDEELKILFLEVY